MQLIFKLTILFLVIILTSHKPLILISKDNYFTDRDNRIRTFHGINILATEYPFRYELSENYFDIANSLSNIDINFLVDMGINAVRLGIVWEVYEKEEGKFDNHYIEHIREIVNKLGDNGIFTIIVNNQNLFSSSFCGFGVPEFYVNKATYQKSCDSSFISNILNKLNLCSSITNARTKESCDDINKNSSYKNSIEISTLYEELYNKDSELFNQFIQYWKNVMSYFDNHRYIIGFDIWNNIQVSNIHSSVLSHVPSYQTNRSISYFYSNIEKALSNYKGYNIIYSNPIYPDSQYTRFSGYSNTPVKNGFFSEIVQCTDFFKYDSLFESKVRSIYDSSIRLNIPSIISSFTECYINNELTEGSITKVLDEAEK